MLIANNTSITGICLTPSRMMLVMMLLCCLCCFDVVYDFGNIMVIGNNSALHRQLMSVSSALDFLCCLLGFDILDMFLCWCINLLFPALSLVHSSLLFVVSVQWLKWPCMPNAMCHVSPARHNSSNRVTDACTDGCAVVCDGWQVCWEMNSVFICCACGECATGVNHLRWFYAGLLTTV